MTTTRRLSLLALFTLAAALTACTNPNAPQSAPAPGSANFEAGKKDDTGTYVAANGIRIMRGGVVSPKCRRSTIFTVTQPCEGLDAKGCKAAAEKEAMIRAKNGGNNLLFVTGEGADGGEYKLSSQVFHCASDAFDLGTVPGAHHVQ